MMRIEIKAPSLREVQAQIAEFSERRLKSVVATTLTRTARQLSRDWQEQINRQIDRPMPITQKATRFEFATATSLQAKVAIKDAPARSGIAQLDYLAPHEYGGGRLVKKFELALINAGKMPRGYMTVPGEAAQRDQFGNVSRSQIIAVVRALGTGLSDGYRQVISADAGKRRRATRRHGVAYVSIPVGHGRISPGIYARRHGERSLTAVFLFKRAVRYDQRLDLERLSDRRVHEIVDVEFARAFDASVKRLRARQTVGR